MTYPPQPGQPYGKQPDPYGQGGGYPHSGGFPQQGGQYGQPGGQQPGYGQPGGQQPGYDQYAGYGQYAGYPQGGQYGQPAGPGGFGGPPPANKSKTGLWIGLSAGAVVVVALLVTAFLVPGFLLSDEASAEGGPEDVANAIVAGLNSKDRAALTGLTCTGASEDVDQAIESVDSVSNARLNGELKKVSESEYTAPVEVTVQDQTLPFEGALAKEGDTWCWQDIMVAAGDLDTPAPHTGAPTGASEIDSGESGSADPGTDTGTGSAAAEVVIDQWISKINSGDEAGAMSLVCEAEKPITQRDTDELISGNAQLEVAEVSDGTYYVSADYTGTVDGKPVTGSVSADNFDETGFCIGLVFIY